MNLKKQRFFIRPMVFFSILLPGALLTYLLMGEVGPAVLGDRYATLAGAEAWAVFLFASYLFGHLVFLLGSWLDGIYDWLRDRTLNWQIRHVASRGRVLSWPIRVCVSLVFKRERYLAVNRAAKVKESVLAPLQAKDAINAFQWCKALLNIESPQSLAVGQPFEADSKFFRWFTVVLLLLLFLLAGWPWQHHWPLAGIAVVLGLFLLALYRYMEQPFKATNQAYGSVITLTAQGGRVTLDKPAPIASNPTHAGGVVFRTCDLAMPVDVNVVTTRFFLMQDVGRGRRKDKERRHEWLEFQRAVARANYAETRNLLEAAERQRTRT